MDAATTISSPEIISLILGGSGALALMWVRDKIEAAIATAKEAREAATSARDRGADDADDWHEFAKSIAESMASVAATIKHHGERIDRLEGGAAVAAANAAEMQRTVIINGEQARVAIADMNEIKVAVRTLTETSIRMGALIEAHDRRTIDTATKLDALAVVKHANADKLDAVLSLLTRATSSPAAARQ